MGALHKHPARVRDEAVTRVLEGELGKDVAADMGLPAHRVTYWVDRERAWREAMDARAEVKAMIAEQPKVERGVLHVAMLGKVMGL